MFYDDDDDSGDEDDDDDNVELQETQPSSTECESSVRPAKELNLLVRTPELYKITLIFSGTYAICLQFGTTG